MSAAELSARFFLELAAVLVCCRAVSWLGVKLGQPPVVGEMIAGVVIGPSLLGHFCPGVQQFLFPASSRVILYAIAQLGLALYMFTVGLDFRSDLLRQRLRSAAAISASGIAAPCLLGCAIGGLLYRLGGFFPPSITAAQAVPYVGASMAITAFPMLARIIFERRLTGTRVGVLALAAGAFDDAAAWGILALVLASVRHDWRIAGLALGGAAGFILIIFRVLPRPLSALARWAEGNPGADRSAFVWVMILLALSAWYTDAIGLYAVFGAFFLGVALPRGKFSHRLQQRIEPVTSAILLPLFFVYSGLNTRIDLVNTPQLWLVAFGVLAAAVLGKMGACYGAARLCGEDHASSLGIGALMNARGLMELIILNIGLERGLITSSLFSILVLMAVATTVMATPLFNWVTPDSVPVPPTGGPIPVRP